MALISKTYTFSSGTTIVASEHNTNFDTLYNCVNGNIDNANIGASAAIADTKLAQITTASKVSGAALTSLSSIPSGAGAIPAANVTNWALTSEAQGDIAYRNATVWVRLAAGTSGQYLKTQGTGANPTWASVLSASVLDYGSSASSSTERGIAGSTLKICFGSVALSSGTIAITNLPFTNSTSYTIVGILDTDAGTQSQAITVKRDSASQSTFTDSQSTSKTVHWVAIGI